MLSRKSDSCWGNDAVGFVEDEQAVVLRAVLDGSRDGDKSAVGRAEGAHRAGGGGVDREPFDQHRRARVDVGPGDVSGPMTGEASADCQVFGDGEVEKDSQVLVYGVHPRRPRGSFDQSAAATAVPSTAISPAGSHLTTPHSPLINVDFPDPFPPIRAWISPGRIPRSTLSRATVPG